MLFRPGAVLLQRLPHLRRSRQVQVDPDPSSCASSTERRSTASGADVGRMRPDEGRMRPSAGHCAWRIIRRFLQVTAGELPIVVRPKMVQVSPALRHSVLPPPPPVHVKVLVIEGHRPRPDHLAGRQGCPSRRRRSRTLSCTQIFSFSQRSKGRSSAQPRSSHRAVAVRIDQAGQGGGRCRRCVLGLQVGGAVPRCAMRQIADHQIGAVVYCWRPA
jgi:hypothetical protein